jgi:formylglycine-generating enzyme required for sulfatase activity
MTVIAESVFQNDDLYLRVWFDDGSAGSQLLSPDQRVVPAAFAIRAREADAVADGAITEAMLSPALLNKLLGATSSNAPTGMATVAAGSFAMGEDAGSYDRSPSRQITLAEFFIDTHEVDKDTWDTTYTWAIANGYDFDNAGSAAASTHPVCQLNWYDIVKWCNARSEQDGLTPAYYTNQYLSTIYRTGQENLISTSVKWDADGYRLPTEAEWEKAARGGLSAKTYPWGGTIETSFANYNGSGDDFEAAALPRTTPVGYYNGSQLPAGSDMANGLGLYDVAGNISEWVWDRYQRDLYKDETATTTDPRGPDTGTSRVLRGGSWGSASTMLGCAIRDFGQTDNVSYSGFRCVRSEK